MRITSSHSTRSSKDVSVTALTSYQSLLEVKMVDPLEVHEEVTTALLLYFHDVPYWPETKRNAVIMFTAMHRSDFQRQLMDLLNEIKVTATLPSFSVSSIYPEGPTNKEWLNIQNKQTVNGRIDGSA